MNKKKIPNLQLVNFSLLHFDLRLQELDHAALQETRGNPRDPVEIVCWGGGPVETYEGGLHRLLGDKQYFFCFLKDN